MADRYQSPAEGAPTPFIYGSECAITPLIYNGAGVVTAFGNAHVNATCPVRMVPFACFPLKLSFIAPLVGSTQNITSPLFSSESAGAAVGPAMRSPEGLLDAPIVTRPWFSTSKTAAPGLSPAI